MRALRWSCLAIVAIASTWIARAQSGSDAAVLFEGARLITGDGRAIERSAFVVERGTFTAVGVRGAVTPPRGARRIDLTGKTVMPALVDVHTHLGYRRGATFAAVNFTRENVLDQLNRFAYYGVAAVASAGTDRGELTLRLRDQPHPGARVRTAWRGIALPEAGPNPPMRDAPYGITTEAEARAAVRELAAKRVDFVKIWVDDRNGTVPKLTPPVYRAIIDEAHMHGLRVAAHIATLADAKDLVRSLVDGFLHAVRDRAVDDELLALLRSRPQVFFTLTLYAPRLATYAERPAWLDDPLLRETTPDADVQQFAASFSARTPAAIASGRSDWDTLAHNVAALNTAGVRLALGTDVGGSSAGGLFGFTEHVELEHMVAAGLTPAQAIAAATKTAAEILRLTDLGDVAVGKSADFIVLTANPLELISNTRRIADTYVHGDRLDRASLRRAWTTY